jgi:hypothetical protein
MWVLLLVGGNDRTLVGAWWVHRHQRDFDAYQDREFQPPLVFQWPGWH